NGGAAGVAAATGQCEADRRALGRFEALRPVVLDDDAVQREAAIDDRQRQHAVFAFLTGMVEQSLGDRILDEALDRPFQGPRAKNASAPRFDVMIRIACRKSAVRPWPSVNRPSSSACSSTFSTSGCAFSTSSSSTTWYGLRRIFSARVPPSS